MQLTCKKWTWTKEFFRTCNVLPFSCTHLAMWRYKGKVKGPRYMQNKKDSRISLTWTSLLKVANLKNCWDRFGNPNGIKSFAFEFLITDSPVTQNINGVPVLVNASEVHKSQEIISLLKHTYNLNVHVQSKFEGAGFLLSSR